MNTPDDFPVAKVLRREGIRLTRRFGQNFMVDRNMLDFMVSRARLSGDEVVLEVGTGVGFLTQRLVRQAAFVVSAEIDAGLYRLSSERLGSLSNLSLLHCDDLAGDHSWSSPLQESLSDALRSHPGAPLRLVSNLPYNIATAVLRTVIEDRFEFASCLFTCQREVADRLTAPPGSRRYGYVTVITELSAETTVVRTLPPSVFWPRPAVLSALVEVLPLPRDALKTPNVVKIAKVLSHLMKNRRKEIFGVLNRLKLDEQYILMVRDILLNHGIDRGERVFRLSPMVLGEVADVVCIWQDAGLRGSPGSPEP